MRMGRVFLDDLYYGRITPWERKKSRRTADAELSRRIEQEKAYFTCILSKEDYGRLEQLENLHVMQYEQEKLESFRQGLKLGAEFMDAICCGDEE